jgi:hypothetical protein
MDPSPLLADVGKSESVVLVPTSQAEALAAGLGRARLTDNERALLRPARVEITPDLRSVTLSFDPPLREGRYSLLVSPRLRDGQGLLLRTLHRADYELGGPAPQPVLVSPAPDGFAPLNQHRLRVSLPMGRAGSLLRVVGAGGPIAAAPLPDQPGEAIVELPVAWDQPAFRPGETIRLELDGQPLAGQSFQALACIRAEPPSLLSASLVPTSTAAAAAVSLDWPAAVRVSWVELAGPLDGDPAELFESLCGATCPSAVAAARCAPTDCGPVRSGCRAELRLGALQPRTSYLVRTLAADDEGRTVRLPIQKFSTLDPVPWLEISEVMASPTGSLPRADGEYLELWNLGAGAVDVGRLALVGRDAVVRPLLGTPPPVPVFLRPGERALAVGASFDAGRYELPPGLPILRAATQRLLGHGLDDAGAQAVSLLLLAEQGAASRLPLQLSIFPGVRAPCAAGASLERVFSPMPSEPIVFRCGDSGGTPGW